MVNYLKNILEKYLIIIGLPCGYRSNSKIFVCILLTLIVLSISYSSGIYNYLISNSPNNWFPLRDEIILFLNLKNYLVSENNLYLKQAPILYLINKF